MHLHAVSVFVKAGKHTQTPLTLVNVDLTLGQNLRELPLQLTVLLIIRKRLDRSGAHEPNDRQRDRKREE